jgi:hypothetical protein
MIRRQNVPVANYNNNNSKCVYADQWGPVIVCNRQKNGVALKFPLSYVPSLLDIWEVLFPKLFVTDVMLPLMNENVELG